MARIVRLIAAGSLAATAALGFVHAASAGQLGAAPLTIVKTVEGPVPPGTTFTATIHCDDDIIETNGPATDTVTVTFDATGQNTTPDTFTFDDPGSCTVTETAKGGAATTTYACAGTESSDSVGGTVIIEPEDPICPTAGPQAGPITVNIVDEDQQATVTIHNTFVAAVPESSGVAAEPIVVEPTFTG